MTGENLRMLSLMPKCQVPKAPQCDVKVMRSMDMGLAEEGWPKVRLVMGQKSGALLCLCS